MKIHSGLLTHDGVAPSTAGKVVDLGFDGDFDVKNTAWNTVFVAFAAKAGGTDMTVKVQSVQSTISAITNSANTIGTFVVPAASVQKGGAFGVKMPTGLKRYFTLAVSGTTLPATVTAGITDVVDTDTGFNWTNYKASTGSSEVTETREATTADIAAHAALTSGVHGLT